MMFDLATLRAPAGALVLLIAGLAHAGTPIESWTTVNGARVLFSPAPVLPMIDARVVFSAGSSRDSTLAGLAALTNGLLSEGAASWSADELAERLDRVGAQFSSGSLRDMAWVSIRSLAEPRYLDVAVENVSAVLSAPRFEAAAVERDRNRMLSVLKSEAQSPGKIAEKAFYHVVYGDHPYGSPSNGTEQSLAAITRDDIKDFHSRYYVARNAVIAIVGALDRSQAEALAERMIAGLPAGEPAPEIAPVPAAAAGRTEISHPSTQSHLYLGQTGMRRGDPDYFALFVGNHVLGGSGLVSLLAEEVREKRGLSYSVSSDFSPMQVEGPFETVLQTKNEQIGEAEQVARETIRAFIANGPSAAMLERSKKNITGGFPLRIDSNAKKVQYLAMIGFYRLPLDWLDRFNERVDAVTAEQIRDAFRRRVDPDRFATVVVGGAAGGG